MAKNIANGEPMDFKDLAEVSQAWQDYHGPAYASARFFAPQDHSKCEILSRVRHAVLRADCVVLVRRQDLSAL